MDQILQALVMGIVQGLTEFLPISSSGHHILIPYLLGWDAVLHRVAGVLRRAPRRDAGRAAGLLPRGLGCGWSRPSSRCLRDRSFRDDPDRRLAWLLVLSTIPAAVIAVLLNDLVEESVPPARPRGPDARDRGRDPVAGRQVGPAHAHHRPPDASVARWGSGSPRRWPWSRASAAPASRCPRGCSRAWTVPMPPATAS